MKGFRNGWGGSISLAGTALTALLCAGNAQAMGSAPKSPDISIHEQRAHLSPAMLNVGSVFMKIINSGKGDDALVRARTKMPDVIVEIHDVVDGKMVKVDKIPVSSLSIVELKPRSLHIMLFKLPKDMKEGSEFILYLRFEKSGEKPVKVTFTKPSVPHKHHSMH